MNDIIVVDIGSRNGIQELPALSNHIIAYGFEPNVVEYNKLLNSSTDAEKYFGVELPKYKKVIYSNYAVGHIEGNVQLNITNGPGATSTLIPNMKLLEKMKFQSFCDVFNIVKTEEVPMRTLNSFFEECKLNWIDYIKLDTQGNEYEILSTFDNLKKISVIKTEVEFVDQYKSQKLYYDIGKMLVDNGFEQVGLRFGSSNYAGCHPEGLPGKQLLWGDAYFIKKEIPEEKLKSQISILVHLDFDDVAYGLNREHKVFSKNDLEAIINQRNNKFTLRRKLKNFLRDNFKVLLTREK